MNNTGYIKVYRKMTQWEWYQDPTVSRVYLHLLLSVNHAPGKWRGIEIHPGQHITSYQHLADALGIKSKETISRALKKLEKTGEITTNSNGRYTIITLNNFTRYQNNQTEDEHEPNTDI